MLSLVHLVHLLPVLSFVAFLCVFFLPVQVPGPAPNLQAVSNSPTSVSVNWDKPLTGNGELLTYKLYYTDTSIGNEQVWFIYLFVSGPHQEFKRQFVLNECF